MLDGSGTEAVPCVPVNWTSLTITHRSPPFTNVR